ncbi:aspartate aminotransferase family protein [Sinorhizobium americanum]|uniref:Glutamate-1-semialdehyde aminotransferase n=1 Tax=Sinorhizobium americanum TaxID=194963 RepID=A0A1L3LTJ4_9HYPH|nr:aminotransferase class III-fold pyridoxal phosphate-dependent enzyme [Sinorhizobium americanum]APG93421.1 glutamate-1-semialdehyde aminotransferase [Sinorhizobium americanum]OAP45535.1 glutamate-1-semialdehyde 2,1-aminomutase [Sinorhizobium americanum]
MLAAPESNSTLESSLLDARSRFIARHPRSAELHSQARTVMPGGNTRSVLYYQPFPIAMDKGEGSTLWDIDGNEFVDLCGEYTAGLFGHSESRIHAAVHQAMTQGLNLAAVGRAEYEFANLICARFPSMELVRFTNSGTEANLLALTAARVHTGRDMILAFPGGYHGGVLLFTPQGPSPVTVPFPFLLADYNDTDSATAVIEQNRDRLAAVIVEPMLGSGGCIPAEISFLKALREATREAGALLIFDEVMTSRMSDGGLQKRLGINPDLTTLGKYMAGGMSFGAFGGRADVMSLFEGRLSHAGTFNNNVLSMAAGRVALGEIFTKEVAEELYVRGERLRTALNDRLTRLGVAMHFSGVGSVATAHYRAPTIRRPYSPTAQEEDLRELFFLDMVQTGFYLARRGMFALSLPVLQSDLDRFVDAVENFASTRRGVLESDGAEP